MKGLMAAVVTFFLLMCVKCLLFSQSDNVLQYETDRQTDTHAHSHAHTKQEGVVLT